MNIIGDDKIMRPVDDLLVRLVGGLRTERRVSHETLKHDGSQRPPVTLIPISLLQEDFGCNIIRRSHGRICLLGETEKR